jgi:hypothetical protein
VAHRKTATDLATTLVGVTVGLVWSTLAVLLLVLVPATIIARSPDILGGALCAAGDVVALVVWTRRVGCAPRSDVERILLLGVCAASAALLSAELLRVVVSS